MVAPRALLRVAFPALLAVAAGCAGKRFTIENAISPSGDARVTALGARPRITVANNGPGALQVAFTSRDSVRIAVHVAERAATKQSLPGPVAIDLAGPAGCSFLVIAEDSTGLKLDLIAP